MLFSWFISIRHGRYHGIARFFSFESIFLIVMLNSEVWFKNASSFPQVVSWILMVLSAYIAVAGFILLRRIGKPSGGNFENTTQLVKTGLYKIIRHPLYFSLFLLGTGAMLKHTGTWQLLLGALNLVSLWFTARIEEREMIARFGDEYRQYMKESKMFIPYIL
jgi:protein-S-isoprenylcysteine O-methyltransferase Ste14